MKNSKKKILIVDDEEDLTWSLSKRLGREGDALEVLYANSGNAALSMLATHQFDLLVTDLRMPGIDGFQLLDEVRVRHPGTQVIVMTAFGSPEVRKALDGYGTMGYIEKPFDFIEFRNLIHQSLGYQDQTVTADGNAE